MVDRDRLPWLREVRFQGSWQQRMHFFDVLSFVRGVFLDHGWQDSSQRDWELLQMLCVCVCLCVCI